jgi:hypothetical protein
MGHLSLPIGPFLRLPEGQAGRAGEIRRPLRHSRRAHRARYQGKQRTAEPNFLASAYKINPDFPTKVSHIIHTRRLQHNYKWHRRHSARRRQTDPRQIHRDGTGAPGGPDQERKESAGNCPFGEGDQRGTGSAGSHGRRCNGDVSHGSAASLALRGFVRLHLLSGKLGSRIPEFSWKIWSSETWGSGVLRIVLLGKRLHGV